MEFTHLSPGIPLDSTIAEAAKAAAAGFIEAGFSDYRPTSFRFRLLDGTELYMTVHRRFPVRELPGFSSAAIPPGTP